MAIKNQCTMYKTNMCSTVFAVFYVSRVNEVIKGGKSKYGFYGIL